MNASISVVCYKSKTLANGEFPLMLRVAKDGKRTMKSLGVSVNPIHWDFDRNEPKPTCPNKELINKIILKTRLEFQEKLLEKKANDEEFTASSLIHEKKEEIKAQTVEEFYLSLIAKLKEKGQVGTSYAYLNSYRMLKNFNKGFYCIPVHQSGNCTVPKLKDEGLGMSISGISEVLLYVQISLEGG